MKKPNAEITRHLVLALASAVQDRKHKDTRAIVEALSQEVGVNLPADWHH